MKKISNILGLWLLMLAMVTVVACEGSDAPYNGYVETTQDNAATLVLKGYENPQAGFTVFEPDGFQSVLHSGQDILRQAIRLCEEHLDPSGRDEKPSRSRCLAG